MQRLTDATNRAEREKKEEMVGRKKEEEEYIGLQSRRKGQRREEPCRRMTGQGTGGRTGAFSTIREKETGAVAK